VNESSVLFPDRPDADEYEDDENDGLLNETDILEDVADILSMPNEMDFGDR